MKGPVIMKEIDIKDLCKFVNPMLTCEDPAVAIACDGNETNGLTIGWAGFGTLWRKCTATVYVHKDRYSKHIFDNAQYYSVCYMKPCDKDAVKYFGTVSGRNEDKMAGCGLTVMNDEAAPYFAESRVAVICRVMGKSDFNAQSCDEGVREWYARDGVHTQYYGEIIKVLVSE